MRRLATHFSPLCTVLQTAAAWLLGTHRMAVAYVYRNQYCYPMPRQRTRF